MKAIMLSMRRKNQNLVSKPLSPIDARCFSCYNDAYLRGNEALSMGEQFKKKHISAGLLAHVDAGKTTLSEALLYVSGARRSLGRVDHRDAYLDTHTLERARGITIFSKQARLETEHRQITLVDTPGHVDFSAETERTLPVVDCAVLVISGTDGVQAHTVTLWRLLERYHVPTFLFINKMDLPGTDRKKLLSQLQQELVQFLEDSVRFYNCQFIISTHSPFLLAMRDALIYDLDSVPVRTSEWTELKNVRVYYEFFKRHMREFE